MSGVCGIDRYNIDNNEKGFHNVKIKRIIVLCFVAFVLANFSFIQAQATESLSGKNDTTETSIISDTTRELFTEQPPVDTVSNKIADTSYLSDDDIIMVDKAPAIVDTMPPIEKMPVLTKFVEADYPEEIYKQGIEGVVLMELLVNDSGIVDSVSILKGVHPVLDSSATRAAHRFLFVPAIAGGETVPVLIQYEYRFELKEVVKKIEE